MAYVATVVPLVITSLLFTGIAGILVVLRIGTRLRLKIAGIDDWLAVGALAASILFCVVIFEQIKHGLGTPFTTIEDVPGFVKCLWGTIPCYNMSLILTKLSIVFQYKRIFTTPTVIRICNYMTGVLVVYGLWCVIGSSLMCIPVAAFWDESIKGHCMDRLAFWFSNAAVNIATDIIIFATPMPLLRKLQLPKKQKIGLMFVFGFGAFVCITSVVRLKSLYEISVATDTALEGVNAGIWSGIEINVALACASLPAIKPLISRVLPQLLSSHDRSTRNNRYGYGSHPLSDIEPSQLHSQSQKAMRGGTKVGVSSRGMPGEGAGGMQKKKSLGDETDEETGITVRRTVHMQSTHAEDGLSREGSERSLVGWKANIYSVERRQREDV